MQFSSTSAAPKFLLVSTVLFVLSSCQTELPSMASTSSAPEVASQPVAISALPVLRRANSVNNSPARAEETIVLPPIDLWERIRTGLAMQNYYDHPDVIEELKAFTDNQPYFDQVTERATPFLYYIIEELETRGLPLELALIPFVESSFNPNAYSSGHAVGLWQFMGATAESYGLQRDWWYDGRRDPLASTTAALDYLEDLNAQFDGDWLLAIAAYNAGDGNVRRAMRRNRVAKRSLAFWDLPLPRETRAHVPKVLALASLINSVDEFPVELATIANTEPLVMVEVGAQIDFAQAAQMANMDYEDLRALNPGYLQWATHPDQPQHIAFPLKGAEEFARALESTSLEELLSWDYYEIQPGDSLGSIASRLGTSVDVLQRVNNLRSTRIIAGDTLMIPRGAENMDLVSSLPVLPPRTQVLSVPDSYVVRSGDNLWSIARRYDLKSADIALWSGLDNESILRPGQRLKLRTNAAQANAVIPGAASPTTYVIRRGDTMLEIASRFSLNLGDLLRWNSLTETSVIHPGREIQLNAPESRLN